MNIALPSSERGAGREHHGHRRLLPVVRGCAPPQLGLFRPASGLAPRGLWLSQTPGQAKVIDHGLAMAWPRPSRTSPLAIFDF
jgi:hypothetical protein